MVEEVGVTSIGLTGCGNPGGVWRNRIAIWIFNGNQCVWEHLQLLLE